MQFFLRFEIFMVKMIKKFSLETQYESRADNVTDREILTTMFYIYDFIKKAIGRDDLVF